MIRAFRSRLATQSGVAMVTVIFVGAALTAVAASASLMAINQMRASGNDASGARAEAYGEAGLGRFLNELRLGTFGISPILGAGCTTAPLTLPQGVVGDGTYTAQLTVYNPTTSPRVPVWTGVPNTTSGPCAAGVPPAGRDFTNTRIEQLYAISSTGAAGEGRRMVRYVVSVVGSGLPVGVFVNSIDANGNPDFTNVSIFAAGDVVGRDKMDIGGIDAYYSLYDVYGTGSITQGAPAAVHALGAIYGTTGRNRGPEHPPNPNCTMGRGPQGQSMWDSSGTGGPVTAACTPTWSPPAGWTGPAYPPTTLFTSADMARVSERTNPVQLSDEQYESLKSTAKTSGLYCYVPKSGSRQCTKNGVPYSGSMTDITGLPDHFVAYYDFEPGSNGNLGWMNNVTPCPTRSATVVVRNGDVKVRSGNTMYGSFIVPEGTFDSAGSYTLYGTVIANSMRLRGTAGFALDDCAVNNQPSTTLSVTTGRWSEVDR